MAVKKSKAKKSSKSSAKKVTAKARKAVKVSIKKVKGGGNIQKSLDQAAKSLDVFFGEIDSTLAAFDNAKKNLVGVIETIVKSKEFQEADKARLMDDVARALLAFSKNMK